jgi:hypothetical protein
MDEYERQARLYPALLTMLPVGVLAIAMFPSPPSWWKGVAGLAASGAVAYLATHLARPLGRRKQDELFKQWGGMPTTLLLRYGGAANRAHVASLHQAIGQAVGTDLPTEDEEALDPHGADGRYEAAIERLKEMTRDRNRFPLVFSENCGYGFRRNLYGLRPFGIGVAGASAVLALVLLALALLGLVDVSSTALGVAAGIDILSIAVWKLAVDPEWVQESGFTYAERLVGSAVLLQAGTR